MNRQNYRIWGTEKPEIVTVRPLNPLKITVWAAMNAECIIGPVFIEETVRAEVYNQVLQDWFIPRVAAENMFSDHWFMQDGAPPHRTESTFNILENSLDDRVIALGYNDKKDKGIDWPPYSPDLNPLDFFLWGTLKDRIYSDRPTTIADLKNRISKEIREIPSAMLARTVESFEARLRHVIASEGSHFENLIH